jgi:hypothetical protein
MVRIRFPPAKSPLQTQSQRPPAEPAGPAELKARLAPFPSGNDVLAGERAGWKREE